MKYLIINGSPRPKGTSKMLTKYFAGALKKSGYEVKTENLYQYMKDMSSLLIAVKESECIVVIGPCYIGTYPADVLYLLQQMQETPGVLHGQSLYGVIQGGMPYVHTHESAIKMLECYAEECDVIFKGGFVLGGGAVLNGQPLEKVIGAKKIVPAVHEFIQCIGSDKVSPSQLYRAAAVPIPGIMARILAWAMCRNLRKKFEQQGIDYKAPSPYLRK